MTELEARFILALGSSFSSQDLEAGIPQVASERAAVVRQFHATGSQITVGRTWGSSRSVAHRWLVWRGPGRLCDLSRESCRSSLRVLLVTAKTDALHGIASGPFDERKRRHGGDGNYFSVVDSGRRVEGAFGWGRVRSRDWYPGSGFYPRASAVERRCVLSERPRHLLASFPFS